MAEAERLFALGVQLHADGDIAGAIAAFEGAELTGWNSGMLHYNLGTAYLALGRYGEAILHFERARKLTPEDEAINRNVRIARERAGLTQEAASPIRLFANRLAGIGGANAWLAFGWILYVCLMGLISLRVWTRRDENWLSRTILGLVPVTLLVLLIACSAWWSTRAPTGVVLSEDAELRALPSLDAASRGTLHPGQIVRIRETRGDWQEVRLKGGDRGWLSARDFEQI